MILTIACPAAHRADANHYAMCLAYGPADALTYGALEWQDAAGNLYTAASLAVSSGFLGAAQSALSTPIWDLTGVVDLVAARRAQALITPSRLWVAGSGVAIPQVNPNSLTAILGMDGIAALAAMGLSPADIA